MMCSRASKPNLVSLPFVFVPESILGVSDPEGPYSVSITSITQDKPVSGGALSCRDGFGVGPSKREPQRHLDSARPCLLPLLCGRDLAEAGIWAPAIGESRVRDAEVSDVEEISELRFVA